MPNVDVNGTVIAFPDSLSPDELNQAVASAADQMQPPSGKDQLLNAAFQTIKNPLQTIRQLAPSNVGKLAGVATANAPGAAGILLNSLPGTGNPGNIMPAVQNLIQRPNQLLQAVKRIAAVNMGNPLLPKEKAPATIGQGAGTFLEMTSMPLSPAPSEFEANGPFTAGVKSPETALPGNFKRSGEALGKSRRAAGLIGTEPEVDSIMTKLENPGTKATNNLLTEARKWAMSPNPPDVGLPKLTAYKELLGQAQAGEITGSKISGYKDVYAQASKKVSEAITKGWPDVSNSLDKMRDAYVAAGGKATRFPWLLAALNPKAMALKIATLAPAKNLAGSAVGLVGRATPQVASIANSVSSIIPKGKSKLFDAFTQAASQEQ